MAEIKEKKKEVKEDRQLWVKVYIVYAFILVFALAIVFRMLVVMFIERDELLKMSKEQSLKYEQVKAIRGNIYSIDKVLLAASVPEFTVRMDLHRSVVSADTFSLLLKPLCDSLHAMYPAVSALDYRKVLIKARKAGKRNFLIKRRITYSELKRLQTFPLFNKGQYKGGFIVEEGERRSRPNDPLARRTIGFYNQETHYGAGLEKQFNVDLQGVSGRRLTQRVANGVWRPIYSENEMQPQNGKDIITTIDTRIQDVAHMALRRCVEENEAHHGCAILMEVSTGRIVAMANLTRQSDGTYTEGVNYAVGESVEPGSTFKLASSIAILEEGTYDTATKVPTGIMEFFGRRMIDSHRAGYGEVSLQKAFEKSSNVGISYLAYETFHTNPQRFVDLLYKMHLNKKTGISLPGEGVPYIKNTKSKSWSKLTLPWMSIGYEIRQTPLQILTLYNAVANNGKMMKPELVVEIRQGDKIIEAFPPEVLCEKIASKRTIDMVKGMLEGVVKVGTARSLSKSPYRVAGKTGTAQVNYADKSGRMEYRASFAGYFPAQQPLYSCIVMITRPQKNRLYGGDLAAPVFKEIADKVYATLLKDNPEGGGMINQNVRASNPTVAVGNGGDIKTVFNYLGFNDEQIDKSAYMYMRAQYINVQVESDVLVPNASPVFAEKSTGKYDTKTVSLMKDVMPNVIGIGARDAVYVLEKSGLQVQLYGRGMVVDQSIPAGHTVAKNTMVILDLN